MVSFTLSAALFAVLTSLSTPAPATGCIHERYQDMGYAVCRFERTDTGLSLYLRDESGNTLGDFTRLKQMLSAQGATLDFAMNGGMYHEDRRPVGLYIADGQTIGKLQTRSGPGNFSLLPNGVFFADETGAHVLESLAYQAQAKNVRFATQSGPMLVIDGDLHPKFEAGSTSFKRRNGVGINEATGQVIFVLSDGPVNFYSFASLFRDHLGTDQALYLDGTISRLYASDLGRNDFGVAMGPIIGHVATETAQR